MQSKERTISTPIDLLPLRIVILQDLLKAKKRLCLRLRDRFIFPVVTCKNGPGPLSL